MPLNPLAFSLLSNKLRNRTVFATTVVSWDSWYDLWVHSLEPLRGLVICGWGGGCCSQAGVIKPPEPDKSQSHCVVQCCDQDLGEWNDSLLLFQSLPPNFPATVYRLEHVSSRQANDGAVFSAFAKWSERKLKGNAATRLKNELIRFP